MVSTYVFPIRLQLRNVLVAGSASVTGGLNHEPKFNQEEEFKEEFKSMFLVILYISYSFVFVWEVPF
jgi:hypothetical protein